LRKDEDGRILYGFVHGNWALDDSGPGGRFCGVRDEIRILAETGCYADFTFPSAPDVSQPPMVNRIYYATDDPRLPRSHFRGVEAAFGRPPGGELLLVTGPCWINWKQRRRAILPALENGEVAGHYPVTPDRVELWGRLAIALRGWPRWIFVKVHTHGAQEANADYLLGGGLRQLHEALQRHWNDGDRAILHYVTPWEMVQCIHILERGDREAIEAVERFQWRFER
jgi:hypothetical protein